MIRRARKPRNKAEGVCFEKLREKGWECTKKGYADFFCYRNGEICFIEVKPRSSQTLSADQIFFMDEMTKKGMACYKFSLDKGLQKWVDIQTEEKRKKELRQKQNQIIKEHWIFYED